MGAIAVVAASIKILPNSLKMSVGVSPLLLSPPAPTPLPLPYSQYNGLESLS